jgi:molybdopterin-guanine dinucleotide biosynthesis protein A
MAVPIPLEIGGYVLAGGHSSRMGKDKALLELAGKPLVRHAVKKLRRVCMDVRILSDNPLLEPYAPLVPDIHPDCGPMSGMEAGLAHSIFEWNLFLAVDMPFVPTAFLWSWLGTATSEKFPSQLRAFVKMYSADGFPQPGLCLLHRDVLPYLSAAIERGEYKLNPVLREAGNALGSREGLPSGFQCVPLNEFESKPGPRPNKEAWCYTTAEQQAAFPLWFANLNTPEDFAQAERHVAALDT